MTNTITTTPAIWYVYLLECADQTLYAGITTDLTRRLKEHNAGGKLAAKYTRARLPVKLVYSEPCVCRSSASKREVAIKRLSRKQKLQLLQTYKG